MFEARNYYFAPNSRFVFHFYTNDYIHNVVSTLLKILKRDVENGNVVLTWSNVVHINVEIDNVNLTLFNVVKRCHTQLFNTNLTLPEVTTSRQPTNNVETTLKCLLGDYHFEHTQWKILSLSKVILCFKAFFEIESDNNWKTSWTSWTFLVWRAKNIYETTFKPTFSEKYFKNLF